MPISVVVQGLVSGAPTHYVLHTLRFLMEEHVLLIILRLFSTLFALIRACLLKIARDYILTILEYGFSKFQIMFGGEKLMKVLIPLSL